MPAIENVVPIRFKAIHRMYRGLSRCPDCVGRVAQDPGQMFAMLREESATFLHWRCAIGNVGVNVVEDMRDKPLIAPVSERRA